MTPINAEIEVKNLDHLGLIAGIIDELGIVETINEQVGIQPGEIVSAGLIVKAIILNGLGFVSRPLYLFPRFFQDKATEHLLGLGILPEHLNDDKIGRVMDKLYVKGLTNIFWLIALAAAKKYNISTNYSHLDATSFSVQGKYEPLCPELSVIREGRASESSESESPPKPISITYGYSRDKRPDLKQFMLDLIVSGDGDIPLFLRTGDGNESDKAVFGKILVDFKKQVDFESIYVADSALYSQDHLLLIKDLKKLEIIATEKKRAGRFILATNILETQELTADEILTAYREQQAAERGFAFLKDP